MYATGSNQGEPFFADYGDVDTAAVVLRLDDDALADTAAVVLRLDDDALALVSGARYNGAGYDVRLEVLGSLGSISVGLDDKTPLRSAESGVPWPEGPAYTGFMERFREAYVRELTAFVEFATGSAESPCTVDDAVEAVNIAEACEQSRREGRPVKVAEVRR